MIDMIFGTKFDVRRTPYFIEIIRVEGGEDDRRERINLRKSSKVLFCSECEQLIEKGERYIRDKFWWTELTEVLEEVVKRKTNFICLKCWEGEVPKFVSGNWMRKKKGGGG